MKITCHGLQSNISGISKYLPQVRDYYNLSSSETQTYFKGIRSATIVILLMFITQSRGNLNDDINSHWNVWTCCWYTLEREICSSIFCDILFHGRLWEKSENIRNIILHKDCQQYVMIHTQTKPDDTTIEPSSSYEQTNCKAYNHFN